MKTNNFSKTTSRFFFILLVGGISGSCHALAEKPYFTVDAVYSYAHFKNNYGKEIFTTKLAPGFNVSGGYMFNNRFGLEFGFEGAKKMTNTATIYQGDWVAGKYIDINNDNLPRFIKYSTKLLQNHFYFGVNSKINVTQQHSFALLVGACATHIKATYTVNDLGVSVLGVLPANPGPEKFSKTKVVPMVRLAFENAYDGLGFRVFTTWKGSLCKVTDSLQPQQKNTIKIKNFANLGVGITYHI